MQSTFPVVANKKEWMQMDEHIFGWTLDEKVMPDQQLAQGDLIKFSEEKNPLRQAGLVVTADCDLENRKHGRLITLVPVVTVRAILENYLLIEACEKQRSQILEFAYKSFSIEGRDEDSVTMAELRVKADDAAEGTTEKIAANFILHRLETLTSIQYRDLMAAIKATTKAATSIESQLRNKGDILILPTPSKLGVSGDIAWVRHIWQESLGNIAMRTSDIGRCPGERVARLDSPFRYRLTQAMGQVFSDIGLPNIDKEFQNDIEMVLKS